MFDFNDVFDMYSNQVCISRRPAHAWFFKNFSVQMSVCVCMFVCPPLRLLITSGVIWTPYDYLNTFYICMATAVIISSGRGLRIEARHGN